MKNFVGGIGKVQIKEHPRGFSEQVVKENIGNGAFYVVKIPGL